MKRLLTVALCLCLLLAGCGGTETGYTPTGNGLVWDEDYTGVATQPASAEGEDALELVLTFYPDKTMNPITCTDFTNRALFSLIYQGLFSVDRGYNVEPQLCKSYKMSEDMLTYTFYLENATFSDGTALTAQDVVASLQAAWESAYYGGRFQHVRSIELSEDGGVTISLYTPYENLPLLLDIPIIRAEQIESDRPLGTGPYVLYASAAGGSLRRRNNWWCTGNLNITANSIPLIAAQSPAQIRDNFEFSELNLVCANPGSDRYVDYRCDYELWDCDNGMFVYLAPCADSDVFSVPEVRAALTHAIDRDSLVSGYYRGFARSALLPASPLSPYYSQTLAGSYGYAPEKFTEALKNANLTGATITLLVNSDDSLRLRVARSIGDMLTQCGLTVTMKEQSGQTYKDTLLLREFDLHLGQTKLSPNMDLSAFFAPIGALSYGGLDDVAAYDLCKQALENHGNYYTLHKTVMDNGLLCPVVSGSYAVYAERGLLKDLTPARDNLFCYSLGKTMDKALIQ